jgi:hypothetical protein
MITAHPTCRNHSTSSSLFWGEEFITFFGHHIWVWEVVFCLFLFLYFEILAKISKSSRIYTKEPKISQISLSKKLRNFARKKTPVGVGWGVGGWWFQGGNLASSSAVNQCTGLRATGRFCVGECRMRRNGQRAVIRSQSVGKVMALPLPPF